jgi:PIN domain nuclease of toxin-antitoxin system
LFTAIGLKVTETPLQQIIEKALKISWTRDVFDRLLSAEAMVVGGGFITADENIKSNLKLAIW